MNKPLRKLNTQNIRTIHQIDTKNQLALSLLKIMSEVGKKTKKRGGNNQ